MKTAIVLAACLLTGCVTTGYQAWESREAQIIEGRGGTKEMVDGYELWTDGTPPHRFQVLGIVSVDGNIGYGNVGTTKSSIVNEIKKAGGSAAVLIGQDVRRPVPTIGMFGGSMMVMQTPGHTSAKWQVVKYLN